MPDEPQAAATAGSETQADQPASQPTDTPAAAPEPTQVDWDHLQSQIGAAYDADPKGTIERLKKHRAIGGIAGSIAERQLAQLRQQDDTERRDEANRKAIEDLEREAEERPLEFAERFKLHREAEKVRERVQNVERATAKKMMEQIGAAYHGIPEWAELTDVEKAKLGEAIAGVPDEDLLPRFNRAALDIVADRRSEKKLSDRLPKERDAWRKEWEAERLASEQGPDLRRPSSTTRRRVNWADMSPEDFNKYYRERYGR